MDAINTVFTQPQIVLHFPPRVIAKISTVCKAFHNAISGREFDGYWRNWLGKTVPLDSMKGVELIYPTLSSRFSPWNKQLLAGLVACIDMKKEPAQLIHEKKLEYSTQYSGFINAQRKTLIKTYHVAIHFFRLDMAKLKDIECWMGDLQHLTRCEAYPKIALAVFEKEGSLDYAKKLLLMERLILNQEKNFSVHRLTYLATKLFSLFFQNGHVLEILELFEAWTKGPDHQENRHHTTSAVLNMLSDFLKTIQKVSGKKKKVQEKLDQFIAKFDQLFPEHKGTLI